ncbi:fimbrin 1 [Striga asiatica]|uniref:Fimbrin 1 n=1 Tax=Striga asiatica TaxID=4170 RepID=A0A5A7RAP4_STRAF|nr:fimbrin 1 [Striga asiatica]
MKTSPLVIVCRLVQVTAANSTLCACTRKMHLSNISQKKSPNIKYLLHSLLSAASKQLEGESLMATTRKMDPIANFHHYQHSSIPLINLPFRDYAYCNIYQRDRIV